LSGVRNPAAWAGVAPICSGALGAVQLAVGGSSKEILYYWLRCRLTRSKDVSDVLTNILPGDQEQLGNLVPI